MLSVTELLIDFLVFVIKAAIIISVGAAVIGEMT
jgi:hypothetical protein